MTAALDAFTFPFATGGRSPMSTCGRSIGRSTARDQSNSEKRQLVAVLVMDDGGRSQLLLAVMDDDKIEGSRSGSGAVGAGAGAGSGSGWRRAGAGFGGGFSRKPSPLPRRSRRSPRRAYNYADYRPLEKCDGTSPLRRCLPTACCLFVMFAALMALLLVFLLSSNGDDEATVKIVN